MADEAEEYEEGALPMLSDFSSDMMSGYTERREVQADWKLGRVLEKMRKTHRASRLQQASLAPAVGLLRNWKCKSYREFQSMETRMNVRTDGESPRRLLARRVRRSGAHGHRASLRILSD